MAAFKNWRLLAQVPLRAGFSGGELSIWKSTSILGARCAQVIPPLLGSRGG